MNNLKIILILSIGLQSNLSFAQVSTSYWKTYIDQHAKKLNLKPIEISDCLIHYRIWKSYQLVDICKINEGIYDGQLINFVYKKTRGERNEKYRVVFEANNITETSIADLFEYLHSENIESLPDSDDIENYPHGFDGTTYIFEVKTPEKYRLYSYWEPMNDRYVEGNIPEVRHVRNILVRIYNEFELRNSFTKFRDSLPKGVYQYGGVNMEIIE